MTNKIKGGLADNKTLQDIATKHGVELSSIESQFKKGLKIESEHTDDEDVAMEIVMDHLMESATYYDELQNAADWAKIYTGANAMKQGIATYKDESVYLSNETLHRTIQTLKGRPVVPAHIKGITPDNMHEHAVGYVVDTFFDEYAGSFGCKFVVFSDKGKELIAKGYGVSTAYRPLGFGPGGTCINTPYDKEITDLTFTHLALVESPRYEDAKVYENCKDADGVWKTINGNRVLIEDKYFKTKTGLDYDRLLEHADDEMSGSIEYMTPSEYIDRCADGFKTTNDELRHSRTDSRLEDLQQKMQDGVKMDMPSLVFVNGGFTQEGVHRVMAAEALGATKIPVLIVTDKESEKMNKKGDKEGRWITVKGTHVFIEDGQSVDEAIAAKFGDKGGISAEKAEGLDKEGPMSDEQLKERIAYYKRLIAKGDKSSFTKDILEGFEKKLDKDELKSDGDKGMEYYKRPKASPKSGKVDGVGEQVDASHFKFEKDSDSMGYPRKIHSTLEDAQKTYKMRTEGQTAAQKRNFERSGKGGIALRDMPVIVKNPAGDGYIVATVGLAEKYKLEAIRGNDDEKSNSIDSTIQEKGETKMGKIEVEENFLTKLMDAASELFNKKEDSKKEDDDKIEIDGEEFSKKELVNSFKKMKENEAEAAQKEEEKKEGAKDSKKELENSQDFFTEMQEKMNSKQAADDKIVVVTRKDDFEKGKKIYG